MSRQCGLQIAQVHIADGFADDCDELMQQCSELGKLTYDKFVQKWKELKFGRLYKHRTTHVEVAEMSEELIHIAKRYLVANSTNFEESVLGLFLVYALLNLQPYSGFAALRLTPDDVPAIARIEAVARREKRLDVLRILGSILIEGPVHYSIVDRPRGLEPGFRKYCEGVTTVDIHGIRPKGVFYRQNAELDLIRDLNNVNKGYLEAKASLKGAKQTGNYIDTKLPQNLETSLKTVINGVFSAEEPEEHCAEAEETDRRDTIHEIKMRAMAGSVNQMNHLRGIEDRNKQEQMAKIKSPEVKKQGSRVKSSNPRKSVPSTSPKKRKTSVSLNRKKKRYKKKSKKSDSDTDDDDNEALNLPTSDDDLISKEDEDFHNTGIQSSKESKSNIADDGHCKDLETTTRYELPILTHPGGSHLIEIEIIDMTYSDKEKTAQTNENIKSITGRNSNNSEEIEISDSNTKSDEDAKMISELPNLIIQKPSPSKSNKPKATIKDEEIVKRINKLPNLSIKKVLNADTDTICVSPSKKTTPKDDDHLFKKPLAFDAKDSMPKMTLDRRDQKRGPIKNKFRRMGLLSVTNINDN